MFSEIPANQLACVSKCVYEAPLATGVTFAEYPLERAVTDPTRNPV